MPQAINALYLFVVFFFGGHLLSGLAISPLSLLLTGMDFKTLSELIKEGTAPEWINHYKVLHIISHCLRNLLPAILLANIFSKAKGESLPKYLALSLPRVWQLPFLAVGIMFCSFPLVSALHYLNFVALGSKVNEELVLIQQRMLDMQSGVDFMWNILLFALTAAVGEEFIYRGVLQKELSKRIVNPHLAIGVTAILFSLMHFQLDGFVPRAMMGWLLGYIYYYGGSLLLAILAHFIFNGIQVLIPYLLEQNAGMNLKPSYEQVNWALAGASFCLVISLTYYLSTIYKNKNTQ